MGKWEESLLDDLKKVEIVQQEKNSWAHSDKVKTNWEETCKAFSEDEMTNNKIKE